MNEFVWADLSTYNTEKSRRFYEQALGWQFYDAGGYWVAMLGASEIAGLFETPEVFQKTNMPHFWMSYIAVEDVTETASIAETFEDAKVELTDDFYDGKIALIRDPQGAGFTVYDGGKLKHRRSQSGHFVWNELHVSEAKSIIPFYERLFGWTIRRDETEASFSVLNSGEKIASILEIPKSIKGKYEYWVCTIAVDDVQATKARIESHGGRFVINEGERILMHDDSGEAFFYIATA